MLVKSELFTISCPVVPCKGRFVEETTCKVGTFLPQSWVLEKQRSGSTFSRTLGFQDSETQLCFKFQTLHTITVPILISRSTKAHGWWPQVNNSCPMHYWIKWFWIAKSGVFWTLPLGSRVNLCRVRFWAKIGCIVWSFFQTPPRVQGHSLQSAVWDLFSQNCLEFTPMPC